MKSAITLSLQRRFVKQRISFQPSLPVGEEGKMVLALNPLNQFQRCMSIEGFQGQHRRQQHSKLR